MVRRLRALYPDSNIVPVDYDPGATSVNQENRIKLMLAIARENLANQVPTASPRPSAVAAPTPQKGGRQNGTPLPAPMSKD